MPEGVHQHKGAMVMDTPVFLCLVQLLETSCVTMQYYRLKPLHPLSSNVCVHRTADKVLGMLRVAQPLDPSQWGTNEVCSWMLNQKVFNYLDCFCFIDTYYYDLIQVYVLVAQRISVL